MAAQLTQQEPPPSLPTAPLADRLLLDNPVPAVLALLAAGLIGLWLLRRAGRGRLGLAAGGAGVALAIAAYVAATVIETPREALKGRTRALIGAVAEVDTRALDDLLDGSVQVRLTGAGIRLDALGKGEIIGRAEEYMTGAYAVDEWSVTSLQAVADGPEVGRTQVRVRVIPEATRFPTSSWWAVDWELIGGAWRAVEIELLQVQRF
ncbi:MAG: hypothetical protein ACF8R7_01485 [Phycisphaerales bacterium JB039]